MDGLQQRCDLETPRDHEQGLGTEPVHSPRFFSVRPRWPDHWLWRSPVQRGCASGAVLRRPARCARSRRRGRSPCAAPSTVASMLVPQWRWLHRAPTRRPTTSVGSWRRTLPRPNTGRTARGIRLLLPTLAWPGLTSPWRRMRSTLPPQNALLPAHVLGLR
jgi:hypothetical protein